MDQEKLIERLSASRTSLHRSKECPAPRELALFLDRSPGSTHRSLPAALEVKIATHLADCTYCLHQVAQVLDSRESETGGASMDLLVRAEALANQRGRSKQFPRWRTAIPVAAAAVLVLAISIALQNRTTLQTVQPETSPIPTTRYADQQALNPQVLAPTEGSVIVPAEQVFRWSEVPGTRFYDVRLVDADGELLLRERVENTRWLIPEELVLRAGQEYFVRVDAFLGDAQFLSSEHVVFSVQEPE